MGDPYLMTYSEKLKDPRWQKKRLEILKRDKWKCLSCGDTKSMLVVHHTFYKGNPWEVDSKCLKTLCQECHNLEHENRGGSENDLILILKQEGFMSHDISAISARILTGIIKPSTNKK